MTEIPDSTVARMAKAIRLTIAIVIVIELALAFAPENVMIRTMRWMRGVLGRQPAPAVEIFGDSVAQGALLASEVEKSLPPGTTVWNAALQGSGPEFTYFLLRHQIASGKTPRAIVIAHSPHTYVTERLGVLVGGFLRWSEFGEAFRLGHHFFDTLYGVLANLSFTLRHHDELGALMKGRRQEVASWNDPIPTEQWVREAGAKGEARRADGEDHGPSYGIHPVYLQRFVVDPGERAFLAQTLALAREHGVTVYWLTLPEHEKIAAAREPLGFTPAYYAFIDSIAARGEIRVLKHDFEVLPGANFTDYTHLRLPAALKLSRETGERLSRDLGSARK